MKRGWIIAGSTLIFLMGLGLMFYPTISNWLYAQSASHVINNYVSENSNKNEEDYTAEFEAARAYNDTLSGDVQSFIDAEAQIDGDDEAYWAALNQVDGIMGILEIPAVDIILPVYHGTDESVLQKGVGHLEGSALPTGDVGNHTVLTGHTGLPSADLFTNLDELVVGDYFYLEILDQEFAYEITNIYVVLPSNTEYLQVQADKDLVTLVTCTPYGVNSHRLLVQGERVVDKPTATLVALEDQPQTKTVSSLEGLPTLLMVAACLGIAFVVAIIGYRYRMKRERATMETQTHELENE
ncbi:class C sortase [Bengtsoniella intestinalis]|uniref:class C sortase n=1 Tax=Bengtsoniella intestinalis TaxID=3073143 RepID=UPI00391F7F36